MEPLPRGANFRRAKTLWEIALHIAGDPAIPYYGDRDLAVFVGSASGESYRPRLRFATGSPVLAHAVCRGELDFSFVNPSGVLTQAYRGTGLFQEPLPVRAVFSYPSWDRFVVAVNPRTSLTSLGELKQRRPALRVSIREDPTHSTRLLVDQLLAFYGLSIAELQGWGGTLQLNGPPGDQRRLDAITSGELDLVFDEGIPTWLPEALANGLQPLSIDEPALQHLEAIGWRRAVLPRSFSPHLPADHVCIDYSGWPLFTRASLADEDAYAVCAAVAARHEWIPWEAPLESVLKLGSDAETTPLDVPLHPGAARWYREQGIQVQEEDR